FLKGGIKLRKFTKKESLVMDKLWESDIPMTAREISGIIPGMSVYSVQQVLSRLLEDGIIKVTGLTHNKNSIARQYVPIISEAKYLALIMNNKNTGLQFATNFVETNASLEELTELQSMIQSKIDEIVENKK
ncbi:BlaI/MecI/CopY family transcriptional regulator, partial [Faecalibaculum rodentium]